jgi:Fur family transcriptional regulator, stress-responsive regulator
MDAAVRLGDAVVQELREAGLRATMARFERRVGHNHHHLVCRGCGRTENTGCVAGERSCLGSAGPHGFVIDEAEVVFWGLCPACQAKGGPVGGTPDHGAQDRKYDSQ